MKIVSRMIFAQIMKNSLFVLLTLVSLTSSVSPAISVHLIPWGRLSC